MILTVDVGNTNIVIGCAEPGSRKIIFEERLYTDRHKSDTEYATSAKSILDLYNISPSDLEGGILSSSVPPVTEPIRSFSGKR